MSEGAQLCFVDGIGGGLAALAAGVARSQGREGALAATSHTSVSLPDEIKVVLEEIGATLPPVLLLDAVELEGVERVDLASWDLRLHNGDGELERLAMARIARDKIARRL